MEGSQYYELSEDQRVENWQLDQFLRLGFNSAEADVLVMWHVDYREAAKLQGCPTELALKILKPVSA